MPKDKGTVNLGRHDVQQRAFVDPTLLARDPKAAAASAAIAARRASADLPKYTVPPAGGPPPVMPALEQPHQTGVTMAAQAAGTMRNDSARVQSVAFGAHGQREGGSIIAPGGMPVGAFQPGAPPQLVLLPNDLLPEEAMKDHNYHQGASSRVAVNQPHMAMKYGVIRGSRLIPPQALMTSPIVPAAGPPGASSMRRSIAETQADLSQIAALQQASSPTGDIERPLRAPVREGAEAAASTGAPAPLPIVSTDGKLSPEVMKSIRSMDDIDFAALRQAMVEDILKNPGQKKIVEARCEPLSLDDLILYNKVQQRVPVIVGKFEPTFESQTADVEMSLKQLLILESDSIRVTEAYLLDKYALMNTVAGVVAINGNRLPTMYDDKGDFNKELFWEKYRWLTKKPMHMLASLGVNYSWFEQRVRSLFKAEEVKNG